MTYPIPTNPPWIMGSSLHTVVGMGSSLETVFGLGSPPFASAGSTPSNFTGVVGWYSATTISGGLSDGSSIQTWNDLSAAGNDLSQITAANQPVFRTGIGKGSRSVVSYDGGIKVVFKAFTLNQPASFAFSFQHRGAWPATAQSDIVNGIGAASFVGTSMNNSRGSSLGYYAGTAIDAVDLSTNSWYAVVAIFNGASSKLYVNGSLATDANPGAGNPGGIALGARTGLNIGATADDLGEVIVTNNAMSGNDVANITAYLKSNWV